MIRSLFIAMLAVVVTVPAEAQSADEQSAYVALIYTPVAGLIPLPPGLDTSRSRDKSGVTFQGRVGHMSRRGGLSLNSIGVGLEVPVGRFSVGGTLAYMSASCGLAWEGDSDCAGDLMLGGTVRTTLARRQLQPGTPAPKGRRAASSSNNGAFVVGFDGSVGYSPRQGEQALALAASVPMALALPNHDVRVLPFLSPGIGYGRLGNVAYFDDEAAASHGTFAFMLGGGFGLEFGNSGLGATVGFQKVFKSDGGGTQLGLGMTWQGMSLSR